MTRPTKQRDTGPCQLQCILVIPINLDTTVELVYLLEYARKFIALYCHKYALH